jgi:hypothetical protein
MYPFGQLLGVCLLNPISYCGLKYIDVYPLALNLMHTPSHLLAEFFPYVQGIFVFYAKDIDRNPCCVFDSCQFDKTPWLSCRHLMISAVSYALLKQFDHCCPAIQEPQLAFGIIAQNDVVQVLHVAAFCRVEPQNAFDLFPRTYRAILF